MLLQGMRIPGHGYSLESGPFEYLCYRVLCGVYCFTKTCLAYVKVIIAFMHVSLVELPFQKVME
jgi:hypothetical protein